MYFWLNCKVYRQNLMTVVVITYRVSLVVIIHVLRLHNTHTGLSELLMREKVNSVLA